MIKEINLSKFKIGILATFDCPLLPFFLSEIYKQDLRDLVIIYDSKITSKKDKLIWYQRTGGYFEKTAKKKYNIDSSLLQSLPFYFMDNHNNQATLDLIKNLDIKCLFNASTPRKISNNIIDSVKYGIINVHPGMLPNYRGCTAVEWAIYNDEKVCNTAHFMTENYDAGPIIHSEFYEFAKDSDYISIRTKVYIEGCILAGKALKTVEENLMQPNDGIIQDENRVCYREPISESKFQEVQEKITQKRYRYQIL
jgi:methionyl-tRNA formyltransferase